MNQLNPTEYVQGRVRKQTRYEPLVKLVVLVIKRGLVKFHQLRPQRNYGIIFIGIGLCRQKLVKKGYSNEKAINEIFSQIINNLESILQEKYLKSKHSDLLIKLTKQKNFHDIEVIQNIFFMQEYDEALIQAEVKHLYKETYKRKGNIRFNQNIFDILLYFKHEKSPQKPIKLDRTLQTKAKIEQQQEKEQFVKIQQDIVNEQDQDQEQGLKQKEVQSSTQNPAQPQSIEVSSFSSFSIIQRNKESQVLNDKQVHHQK